MEREETPKEIRLNDGSRVIVRGREWWMAAVESLHVMDEGLNSTYISYFNIAAIRHVRPNGSRRKGARKRK